MSRWIFGGALALALAGLGCGETTHGREDGSGNTNWLKPCEADAECGELSCLCGSCRNACDAATVCSLEAEASCSGATSPQPLASPITLGEHRDADAMPNDLVVGADGSVTLVGGKGPTPFDLTTVYRNFWVSKLSREADVLWSYESENVTDAADPGRSIVLTAGGETLALSTVYDGQDTPHIRRLDRNGELVSSFMSTPGFTTMRTDGRGGFFATGSNRASDVPNALGRTPTVAWIGQFDPPVIAGSDTPHWQQERQGLEGSISNILVASSDGLGNLVVGGSLGTAVDSNASEPYLARLDRNGDFVWEQSVPIAEVTHCDATAVAMLPDGGSLAAIGCGPRWLRAYEADGAIRWERRIANGVTALAGLRDGGYVVGYGGGTAHLQRYDAQHRSMWEVIQEGCTAFTRLEAEGDAVVALSACEPGYLLSWYGP
ncbi:MAG: hypothetical protein K0R38_862 [Polyangiaceae bacterium]|jgi:hypothetical protein|nr:hypothetical protein [Polyangiaceae bacterium]